MVDSGHGCVLRAAGGVGCTVLSSRCWAGGHFSHSVACMLDTLLLALSVVNFLPN